MVATAKTAVTLALLGAAISAVGLADDGGTSLSYNRNRAAYDSRMCAREDAECLRRCCSGACDDGFPIRVYWLAQGRGGTKQNGALQNVLLHNSANRDHGQLRKRDVQLP